MHTVAGASWQWLPTATPLQQTGADHITLMKGHGVDRDAHAGEYVRQRASCEAQPSP
ncbi:hypothetical protein ACVILJ_001757 [Bradyrhizobium diazoefficiens]|jgi:hypothetical protein